MSERKGRIIKYAITSVMAYLNAVAMQYISFVRNENGGFFGTKVYSFTPESIVWFGVTFFFLNRFIKDKAWKKKGALILSLILGFILGFCSVWGIELLANVTLFDSGSRIIRALFVAVGIMFFTVPFIAFITDFCDKASEKIGANPGKIKMRPIVYFLIIWAIVFVSFVPLFLYTYPSNIFGDAIDALVGDYLSSTRSTHHTPIHWLIVGWFYDLGVSHGSVAFGLQFFTILQMMILSGAIAFLSAYLYKKQVNRGLRIVVLLASVINPVNAYFSVTAEKGTIGMALVLVGIVLLAVLLEVSFDKTKIFGFDVKTLFIMLGFALLVSVGCLFRNNMIYAVAVGGAVVLIFSKGFKRKIALACMFLLTIGLYKAEFSGLVKWQKIETVDNYRESLSVPIMCLTRIAVLHGSEMPQDLYDGITDYIPEWVFGDYGISSADSVKGYADENLLKGQTKRFFGLFIRGFFLYPGDYLDQVGWLTHGYWNPLYEHVLGSTTPIIDGVDMPEGHPDIEAKCLLPFGDEFFTWMYKDDGRYRMPGFAWFFRPALYTYVALFGFLYAIYRKSGRKLALTIVPLMYLGTVFLGPLCQFRYVYFNILCLGLMLYIIFASDKPVQVR